MFRMLYSWLAIRKSRALRAGRGWVHGTSKAMALVGGGLLLILSVGVPSASANPPSRSSANPLSASNGAVTIQVTGAPLTGIASTGLSLIPSFATGDTDYVWYCTGVANAITLSLSSNGSITANGQTGSVLSIPVTVVANNAVVVVAPSGTNYWIRCLPPDFPRLTIGGKGNAAAGYYVTGAFATKQTPGYPMVLNQFGTPVWYVKVPHSAQNTEFLPGTQTIAWANTPAYYLYSLDTGTVSTLAPPIQPFDGHELYADLLGNHWMISVPALAGQNLGSRFPGVTTIKDCAIQELAPNGALVWQWVASQHIGVSETNKLAGVNVYSGVSEADIYRCNSIDVDPTNSDHILVSMRHVGVVLIDEATGNILWKLGGTAAAPMDHEPLLTIQGDPETFILGQHDARFQPGGDISLFDDHTKVSGAARGVEYQVDTATNTAKMVWEYAQPSGKTSTSMGSVRRYDSNGMAYDQVGSGYAGPIQTVIDWGHGAPWAGFTVLGLAGDTRLSVQFSGGVATNRAGYVPPSALVLSQLHNLAGAPLP